MKKSFDKVLVTGATGLLGSWLTEKLISNEKEVYGIALDKTKNHILKSKNILENLNLTYLDISDKSNLDRYFKKNKFDIVIHLAAQTQVGEAINNPVMTFKHNIEGTWNLLDNASKYGFPVVQASSDKAYGVSATLPYLENFPLSGNFPYEFSKSATDLLGSVYNKTYGVKIVSLRCGNIYGGGDLNWERLIPGVLKWILTNQTPVLRTDGTFKRDWVYVEDVSNAYISVAEKLFEGEVPNNAYNFSGKDYLSVIEIYNLINKILGTNIEPIYKIDSKNEIPDQYLSSDLIKKELNIESTISITDGLQKTIEWYKKFFNN